MTTVTGRNGVLAIDIDDPWVEGAVEDTVDLLVHLPADQNGNFAPNLVARAYPFDGPVDELAGRLVSSLHENLHKAQVIDVQMWQGPETRAVVYSHVSPASKTRIRAMDLIKFDGPVAVQVTISSSSPQWPALRTHLEEVARSVRVVDATAVETPAGPEIQSKFNALDAPYAEQESVEVVDYSGVADRQPYPVADMPIVTDAAMDLLQRMSDGYKIGRLGAGKDTEALRTLEDGGFVEGQSLTEIGAACAALMDEASVSLHCSATRSTGTSQLFVWADDSLAFVVAGRGPGAGPEGPEQGTYSAYVIPLYEVSTNIGQWLGLAPAWQLELAPTVIDEGTLNALVIHGEPALPVGGNTAWIDAASQPWVMWTLEARSEAGELEPLTYFSAGRRGQYRPADVDKNHYALIPQPTITVQDQIEDRIQALLFDRPVQLI